MTSTDTARVAPDHHVFHVWREDSTYFDGNALYFDLETAKAHGAYDYEGDEYGHSDPDEDDPEDRPVLTWIEEHGRWALLDGGNGTSVVIEERPVYRPATPDEIAAQDAARAARPDPYAGMSLAEALPLAAEAHQPGSAAR